MYEDAVSLATINNLSKAERKRIEALKKCRIQVLHFKFDKENFILLKIRAGILIIIDNFFVFF